MVTKGKESKGLALQINEACACTVAVKAALLQCTRSVPTGIVVLWYPVSTSTQRNNHNIPNCTNDSQPTHLKTSTHMSTSGLWRLPLIKHEGVPHVSMPARPIGGEACNWNQLLIATMHPAKFRPFCLSACHKTIAASENLQHVQVQLLRSPLRLLCYLQPLVPIQIANGHFHPRMRPLKCRCLMKIWICGCDTGPACLQLKNFWDAWMPQNI